MLQQWHKLLSEKQCKKVKPRATPEASEVLTNNVYMHEICDSVDTVEKTRSLSKDFDSVLAKGGVIIKGWVSNKDLAKNVKERISEVTEVFEEGEDKVLGVVWNHRTNELRFKVKKDLFKPTEIPSKGQVMLTKKAILSKVARIDDPVELTAALYHKSEDWYPATVAVSSRLGRGGSA